MFVKLGRFVTGRYKLVLIASGLFTVLCFYWMSRLELQTQMVDMLPGNEPEVIAYNSALKNFEGIDSIIVVIEGEESGIISYMEDVAPKFAKVKNVGKVIYRSERDFFRKNGLLLLKKKERESLSGMLKSSSLEEFIRGLNTNFEKEYISDGKSDKLSDDRRGLLTFLNTIEDFFKLMNKNSPEKERIKDIADEFLAGPRYMISPDRSLGIIDIRTPLEMTDINNIIPLIEELEKIAKKYREKHSVSAGLAGFFVLQRDEMNATKKDMGISFILSLFLITIIFLIGCKLFRFTILAGIPLMLGISWAMGLTYVIIGSLNMFTAMMGAILIGLGIDYAIHVITIFTEERFRGTDVKNSVMAVYGKVAKGIVTGSVTTAIGFMTFVLSSFKAFREFGLTMGFGILCTLAASIFVLPSLLMIFGGKDIRKKAGPSRAVKFYKKTVVAKPRLITGMIIILLILSVARYRSVTFTSDLKKIEPAGLESLELNDRLIEKFDFSSDITIGITKTVEEAHILKEAADDLDSVGAVSSIADFVPGKSDQKERMRALRRLKKEIKKSPEKKINAPGLAKEIKRLSDNIIEISDLSFMAGETKIVDKCDALIKSGIISSAENSITEKRFRPDAFQKTFIARLKKNVLGSNSGKIITPLNIPENIRGNYVGKDGTYLTAIYPGGDVWTDEFQPVYVSEIRSLDRALTGTSLMTLKIMKIAGTEGRKILIIVALVIFLVLIVDFRSLKYASL
ncbi:MAG: MMPL family transporter, partial [Elusimicrobiota bacterium]|nr:MMPL family transporter [Elusimicrobiota bacterium]